MRCVVQLAASQTDARGSGVGSNDILGLQTTHTAKHFICDIHGPSAQVSSSIGARVGV
jgi:hypothetical protein